MRAEFQRVGIIVILTGSMVVASGMARGDEKVTLSDMHVCCKGCVMAIQNAAAKVPGVTCVASEDDSNAVVTADSKQALQKAVDEITKAGFSGTPDNPQIKIEPIKVPDGKVQKLEIAHVHNCCGKCTVALKDVLKDVPGVKSNTVESKKTSFVVEGDFSADDVVKALMKAGFYPEIKTAN
jgi:periplasmic mercuric ion binding protein